ncbi:MULTISPECIES: hypothetical protein [Alphaproteobacteria]|uniref:Uncharacterized protein n=2 Tax=Alphaproteobacteria TaxID=28211 RepID=A0A512HLP0_9HYPH|nr:MULTISPECIES: hypothetical protein [Alphaproteobacteria]GEO86359.1 hypothetical protein RNA01_32910 [Ciceribacter naphthalenivorans]GLR21841.1 hypothetical protein GCM10007920_16280 [Ciceribacter naphthalenivorans]GLT04697.1 hypothetical protein GCM10007926_16280 [Sphingomonas psychrolutea]
MAKPDTTHLEILREKQHELLWRTTATSLLYFQREAGSKPFCRHRKCHRDLFCCGPMIATPRQGPAIARERERGMSGASVACLPLCMLNLDDRQLEIVREKGIPAQQEELLNWQAAGKDLTLFRPNRRWLRQQVRLSRGEPHP